MEQCVDEYRLFWKSINNSVWAYKLIFTRWGHLVVRACQCWSDKQYEPSLTRSESKEVTRFLSENAM